MSDVRLKHRLFMPPPIRGGGITKVNAITCRLQAKYSIQIRCDELFQPIQCNWIWILFRLYV